MKKKLLIIVVIIVAGIGFFWCKWYFKIMDADKKIDEFITEKADIPSSEILVIEPTEERGMIGDSNKNYIKYFTTKKDFERWKENLKKEGKNYKDVKVKDCEIKYFCSYSPQIPKFNQMNVYRLQYILYRKTIGSFKEIENNFAYPPNEHIKKLLKEENPNFYRP
ncbi:hypothetical protein K5V21_08205 [Clostridium sardiniense]|uniref:Lipoprotein n=1 Tax=Clostridium sardiniense TaxID=29369 RepID=A0ABS7KX87_CLOSR|nr:hypothetical protein [Clostridium sardiniense]MBY0755438.1 hypothetical protein [Clostridium sardiniense]MDQ0461574.1 hypothetical protein [Clostridium sardiniense]